MRGGSAHWDWLGLRASCESEAHRLLANPQDVEDVVQEAMVRAWRKRRSCRTPAAPLPWVLQITRNEAFRHLRRRSAETGALMPDSENGGQAALEPSSDRAALRVDVRRALAHLPAQDQVLVQLRYGEDMTQNRIAGVLDLPEGTIKVRLHRIRQKLRLHLASHAA